MERIDHRIADVVAMRERQRGGRSLDRPVAAHQTLDGAAIGPGHRRVQPQQPRLARDVELPADPDQRERQPREQPIAEVVAAGRIEAPGGAREVRQQRLAAAIADLEQRRRATRRRAARPQHHEVGRRLHTSALVARGMTEIDDAGIRGVRGIELELDQARELLVLAAEDLLARGHHHAPDLGVRERRPREHRGEEQRQRSRDHRRYVTR